MGVFQRSDRIVAGLGLDRNPAQVSKGLDAGRAAADARVASSPVMGLKRSKAAAAARERPPIDSET
jgi:hypothetical protein